MIVNDDKVVADDEVIGGEVIDGDEIVDDVVDIGTCGSVTSGRTHDGMDSEGVLSKKKKKSLGKRYVRCW